MIHILRFCRNQARVLLDLYSNDEAFAHCQPFIFLM